MRSGLRRVWGYLRMMRNPGAMAELDGLRGIAILLVLFRHGVRPFDHPASGGFPIAGYDAMTPMLNGWMGVDLFFVLSGFLVTFHILRRWGERFRWSDVGDYCTKRMLRIVPAYYAFLFFVVAGGVPGYVVASDGLRQQVLYHVLFLQDYIPSQIVVAFWSLGVEEKFYFLIPLLLVPLVRVPGVGDRIRIVALLTCAPIALRCATYVRVAPIDSYVECFWLLRSPFHLACDALLIGTLCAIVYRHRDELPWTRRAATGPALLCAGSLTIGLLLFARPLLAPITWFSATLLFPLLALGFGSMLLGLAFGAGSWAVPFRSKILFFFARISYSLYLVHMVFIDSIYALMSRVPGFTQWSASAQFCLYFPIYAAISVAGALVLHYLVEKPFLILKDRERATVPARANGEHSAATEAPGLSG